MTEYGEHLKFQKRYSQPMNMRASRISNSNEQDEWDESQVERLKKSIPQNLSFPSDMADNFDGEVEGRYFESGERERAMASRSNSKEHRSADNKNIANLFEQVRFDGNPSSRAKEVLSRFKIDSETSNPRNTLLKQDKMFSDRETLQLKDNLKSKNPTRKDVQEPLLNYKNSTNRQGDFREKKEQHNVYFSEKNSYHDTVDKELVELSLIYEKFVETENKLYLRVLIKRLKFDKEMFQAKFLSKSPANKLIYNSKLGIKKLVEERYGGLCTWEDFKSLSNHRTFDKRMLEDSFPVEPIKKSFEKVGILEKLKPKSKPSKTGLSEIAPQTEYKPEPINKTMRLPFERPTEPKQSSDKGFLTERNGKIGEIFPEKSNYILPPVYSTSSYLAKPTVFKGGLANSKSYLKAEETKPRIDNQFKKGKEVEKQQKSSNHYNEEDNDSFFNDGYDEDEGIDYNTELFREGAILIDEGEENSSLNNYISSPTPSDSKTTKKREIDLIDFTKESKNKDEEVLSQETRDDWRLEKEVYVEKDDNQSSATLPIGKEIQEIFDYERPCGLWNEIKDPNLVRNTAEQFRAKLKSIGMGDIFQTSKPLPKGAITISELEKTYGVERQDVTDEAFRLVKEQADLEDSFKEMIAMKVDLISENIESLVNEGKEKVRTQVEKNDFRSSLSTLWGETVDKETKTISEILLESYVKNSFSLSDASKLIIAIKSMVQLRTINNLDKRYESLDNIVSIVTNLKNEIDKRFKYEGSDVFDNCVNIDLTKDDYCEMVQTIYGVDISTYIYENLSNTTKEQIAASIIMLFNRNTSFVDLLKCLRLPLTEEAENLNSALLAELERLKEEDGAGCSDMSNCPNNSCEMNTVDEFSKDDLPWSGNIQV